MTDFPRIASLKTAAAFRDRLRALGLSLGFDDTLAPPATSPLARPFELDGVRVGNRFCILPMEGWDGTAEGEPSDLTRRRWEHFGIGGAKLIWGGEAVAVQHDGRANPRQVTLTPKTHGAIAGLREALVAGHRERFGANADGICSSDYSSRIPGATRSRTFTSAPSRVPLTRIRSSTSVFPPAFR